MRVFLGVFPPIEVARDIHAAVQAAALEHPVRWIDRENLQVTLEFLGEIDDAGPVAVAAQQAVADFAPFQVELGELGVFPQPRRARVGFVQVQSGGKQLARVREAIRARLPESLELDDKKFHAHLTLTRFRTPPSRADLEVLRLELSPWRWKFPVDEVRVVRSHLGKQGARYHSLHAIPLGASKDTGRIEP